MVRDTQKQLEVYEKVKQLLESGNYWVRGPVFGDTGLNSEIMVKRIMNSSIYFGMIAVSFRLGSKNMPIYDFWEHDNLTKVRVSKSIESLIPEGTSYIQITDHYGTKKLEPQLDKVVRECISSDKVAIINPTLSYDKLLRKHKTELIVYAVYMA